MFRTSPERLAWAILLIAFGVFLCIGGSALFGMRWFLLDSTVNLATQIRVGRGTVGVQNVATSSGQQAVRLNRGVARDDLITTDEIAQGYIEFVDSSDQDRVIANVVVLPGSQVELETATRPRFHLADRAYQIDLINFVGRLEIEIPHSLSRDIQMKIVGTHGTFALTEPGMYLLWSLNEEMIIIPRGANAKFTPAQSQTFEAEEGQKMVFNATRRSIAYEVIDELFDNPLFDSSIEPNVPDEWGCYSLAEDPAAPRGTISLFTFEGRRSMYFHRVGQNIGPGATGCRQFLGNRTTGLYVSDYETLRIRATFNIRWHSLPICGTQASECAVMLNLIYVNEYGDEQRWIHGFYAYEHNNPEGTPRTCDSCLIEHERITPGNWYTYESGNLFELPEGFRPTSLKEIRFYTSGHEYEVAIGEIALLAEPADN